MNGFAGATWIGPLLVGLLAACGARDRPAGVLGCDDLALAVSSAPPLDSVVVQGLAGAVVGEVTATLDDPEVGTTSRLPLLRLDGERVALLVPPHPSGALAGGAVEIRFSSGDARCDPLPLRIVEIPPALGEAARVLASLDELLAVQVGLVGATRVALATADPDTLLPPLVPLFIAQAVLDRLAALDARATSPVDGPAGTGGEDYQALFDALLARAGVRKGIAESIRHLRSAAGPADLTFGGDGARAGGAGFVRFVAHRSTPASGRFRQAMECPLPGGTGGFLKPDARTLSCWMNLALHADLATNGVPAETYDKFLTVVGLGASIPHPAAKTAFTSVGVRALLYRIELEAIANLYPRYFGRGSLELDLHPAAFREDDPGPGHWDNVRITARSKGWTLDKTLLGTLLSLGGLDPLGGLGGAGKRIAWDVVDAKAAEWMADVFDGLIVDALVDKGAIGLVTEGGGGVIRLEAQRFGPVDITGPEWSEVRITGSAVQHDLDAGRHHYRPYGVGTSRLQAWTAQGKFGDQFQDVERTLGVNPIKVRLLPARRTVAAGEVAPFMVVVDNAVDPSLSFEATAGAVIEPPRYAEAGGQYQGVVRFRAPEREDDFPARLRAVSTADRSHLRVVKERSATARIGLRELRIIPEGICLDPGEPATFTAYLGNEPAEVLWSATSGDIEPNGASPKGTYVAPPRAGELTISAVLQDDPGLRADATVTVRRCTWNMTIGSGPGAGFYWGRSAELLPRGAGSGAMRMGTTPFDAAGRDVGGYLGDMEPVPRPEAAESAEAGAYGSVLLRPDDSGWGCLDVRVCVMIDLRAVPRGATGTFPIHAAVTLGGRLSDGGSTSYKSPIPTLRADALVSEDERDTTYLPEPIRVAGDTTRDLQSARLIVTGNKGGRITGRVEGLFETLVGPVTRNNLWSSWENAEIRIEFEAEVPGHLRSSEDESR